MEDVRLPSSNTPGDWGFPMGSLDKVIDDVLKEGIPVTHVAVSYTANCGIRLLITPKSAALGAAREQVRSPPGYTVWEWQGWLVHVKIDPNL